VRIHSSVSHFVQVSTKLSLLLAVVNDVNESINLAELPAHQATRKAIEARIEYHFGRQFNYSIDHTNITAAQYCAVVKAGQWAEPFGYAPPAPPVAPPPPPAPIPAPLAAEISGTWDKAGEFFSINAAGEAVSVRSINCTGCCWQTLNGSASASAAGGQLFVSGRREQCGNYPDALRGDLAKGVIKWEGRGADGSWRPSMTDWVKAQ